MATLLDPTTFGYQNFYSATLTSDITAGTLTIPLDTVPTPTSGILVIDPDSATSREVILYTSKGVSNVVCPSDGRGWDSSVATSHLSGTTVIYADIADILRKLGTGELSADPLRTSLFSNFIVSGGVVAQSAGLIGTFSNIIFYLNGRRFAGTSIANKTYTASKDTYVDVTAASDGTVSVLYTEQANGTTPPALTTNYLRVAVVVTSGAAITSVQQTGRNNTVQTYETRPRPNDWWEELGRTTLTAAGDTISVTGITPRKYLRVRASLLNSGQIGGQFRFNNDSSASYNYRLSVNGGADSTASAATALALFPTESSSQMGQADIVNLSAQEKLLYFSAVTVATAGNNFPTRAEGGAKYIGASAPITRVDIINGGSGDFAIGSEVVVLGHD
jgi:hypothetical protein